MLTIPSAVEDALKNGAQKNFRVHFPNGERADICNPNIVNGSVSFKESVCSADSLKFGLFEASVLAFETVGIENITNCKIEVFLEVFCASSVSGSVYRADLGSYVYPIPYGIFIVDECVRQNNINRRKSTAYSLGIQSENWNAIELAKRNIEVPTKLAYQYNPFYASISSANVNEQIPGLVYGEIALANEYMFYKEEIDGIEFEAVFSGKYYPYSKTEMVFFTDDLLEPLSFSVIESEIRQFCSSISSSSATTEKFVDTARFIYENPLAISSEEFEIPIQWTTQKSLMAKGSYIYPFVSHPNASTKNRCYGKLMSFGLRKNFDNWSEVIQIHRSQDVTISETFPMVSLPRTKIGTSRYVCKAEENYTSNECLEGCLEILGAFGRRNRSGQFEIKLIDDGFASPVYSLPKSEYMNCWYEEHPTLPYGKVGCNYIGTDGEEAYIEEKIQNVEPYQTYDLSNNPIIKNVKFTIEEIQALLDVFASNVQNISYVATDISALGLPFLEGGDVIDVEVGDGETIRAFIESRTLSGVNSLRDKFDSEADNNKIGEWHEKEQTSYMLISEGSYQNGFSFVGKAYRSSINGSNGVTGTPTVTENYTGGVVRAYHSATASNGNRACSICSNAKIDLTDYSTLHIEYDYSTWHASTTSTYVAFVIPTSTMATQGYAVTKSYQVCYHNTQGEFTHSGTADIDISSLTGEYYIGADITYRPGSSNGYTDMRIKNMWLEQ